MLKSISNNDRCNQSRNEIFGRVSTLKTEVSGQIHTHTPLPAPLKLNTDSQENIDKPTKKPVLWQGPAPGRSYSRQLKTKSHCKQLQKDATIIDCLGDEMADEILC